MAFNKSYIYLSIQDQREVWKNGVGKKQRKIRGSQPIGLDIPQRIQKFT
jgi:hypothetical protein